LTAAEIELVTTDSPGPVDDDGQFSVRRATVLFCLLLAGLAALGALSGMAGVLLGGLDWRLELLGHFVPYHAAGAAFAVGVFWFFRHGRAALLCGVPCLFHVWLLAPYYLPSGDNAPGPLPGASERGEYTRVVVINLLSGNPDTRSMAQVIDELDADVLCLQEYTPRWRDVLAPALARYPHRLEDVLDHPFGMGTFSRLPESVITRMLPQNPELPTHLLTGQINGRRVSLLHVHTLPPVRASNAASRDWMLRTGIPAVLRPEAGLAVLAGDLNCTMWSPHFRALLHATELRDTRLGRGVLPTWDARRWYPKIPLDHILTTRGIVVRRLWLGPMTGSDHRPLAADLWVPETS
jgi:endonuclease/exonuclease/phosphatase (EEP) superfamily protein YafD